MSNEPTTSDSGKARHDPGLAESLGNPVPDQVRPSRGPMDQDGIEGETSMSNAPIPIPNDDPEVGLTTPVED